MEILLAIAVEKKHGDLLEKIKQAPGMRGALRDFAKAINVPYSTLHRRYKAGMVKKYSKPLKPLTQANKYFRSKWCLRLLNKDNSVVEIANYVHVDVKWCFLKLLKGKIYGTATEKPNQEKQKTKNKNHKIKVMMPCAEAHWRN